MVDSQPVLLDTPKRTSLQEQSQILRAALKDFERDFARENGHKPKQTDIKNDPVIAAKYKQYHKVQDVLSGKVPYDNLNKDKATNRSRGRTHSRRDSGVGSSPAPHTQDVYQTPKKIAKPYDLDPYDAPTSASPKLILREAIGPTPHRDGKVLGLFDLLQRTGATASPSTSARKRKLDELYQDSPAQRTPLKVIQTPNRQSDKGKGDILDFLEGTPETNPTNTRGKLSKTPQSEGSRFQLSQFFATPSTQRILFSNPISHLSNGTPPQESLPGRTPQSQPDKDGLDATPAYLKRSVSFKNRLLSASQPQKISKVNWPKPATGRIGPAILQHFRSSTSNIFTIEGVSKPSTTHQHKQQDDEDYNDDLEALRELEGGQQDSHILIEDSQLTAEPLATPPADDEPPLKLFKKKGQKRTTRKSKIKPVSQVKAVAEPKFVAADDSEGEEDSEVEESRAPTDPDSDVDDVNQLGNDEDDDVLRRKKKAGKPGRVGSIKKQPGMINPNAQSHMNFRTLKIKNKNSRAKNVGRGRFGRRK